MMHLLCSLIGAFLITEIVHAQSKNADPCPNDTTGLCLNAEAIKFVNKLRIDRNIPALAPGSISMFRNAMDHSKVQANRRTIFHQDISRIFVGEGSCRTGLTGENVAYHDKEFSKNAAYFCVMEQWLKSEGHRNNMLSRAHGTTVIAIFKGPGSRVTCTQTFTKAVPSGSGECKPSAGKGSSLVEGQINSEGGSVQEQALENAELTSREENERVARGNRKVEEAAKKKAQQNEKKEKEHKTAGKQEKINGTANKKNNEIDGKEKKDESGEKDVVKSSNLTTRSELRNLERFIMKYWRLYRKLALELHNAKKRRSGKSMLRQIEANFEEVERKLIVLVQKYLGLQKKLRL